MQVLEGDAQISRRLAKTPPLIVEFSKVRCIGPFADIPTLDFWYQGSGFKMSSYILSLFSGFNQHRP